MKIVRIQFILIIMGQLLFSQDISYNQQFQIIKNATYHPNAAALNDGGYIVCGNGSSGDYEVYAQIFNADHSFRGEPFQVNTNTYLEQEFADIICLSDSTILITWKSWNGIFGQLFTYNGLKIGTEFQLVSVDGGYHPMEPDYQIAKLNTGGFIICWVVTEWSEGKLIGDIYGSIYDANIQKLRDTFLVNTYTEDLQTSPKVAVLKNGDFIISWISNNQVGIRMGIYYQMFDESGTKISDEIRATPFTNTYTPIYNLCELSDSGFVFIWPNSVDDYQHPDIIVQRYDNNYRKHDDLISIKASTGLKGLSIVSQSDGGYIFMWECYNDLYGQFVNPNNTKYKNIFKINTSTGSTAYNNDPVAIQLKNNENFFVWLQANPTYFEIYGKYFLEKLVHPLLPYNLVYPLPNDAANSTIVTFAWRRPTNLHYNYSWDIEYKILMDTVPDFENPILYSAIYDTSYKIENLEPGTKYYWKVLAKNLDDDSLWSNQISSFTVNQSLISFSLIQPSIDETIFNINPTFKWNHASALDFNSPWNLQYYLYLDDNENFYDPRKYSVVKDTSCIVDSLLPGSTYFWKVLAIDTRNDSLWSSETFGFFVDYDATEIEQIPNNKIQSFQLHANYPNPFNPTTTIRYDLPEQSNVNLSVYDISGRLLQTLVNEKQTAGSHKTIFDASGLSSGVYFYTIKAGQYRETKKMLLVR